MDRKTYPTDVSDEDRAFVAPYLTLMSEEAPQWTSPVRGLVKTGAHRRMMPHDMPP